MMSRYSWQRVRSRKEASQRRRDEQVAATRRDRAAKKAGTYGLTHFEVIMREQQAARVAAETAEAMRAYSADEPPPPADPFGGYFSDLLKDMKP